MNLSLNEVEALVKKACRGSGLNWGASAEVARCMRWLVRYQPDSLAALLALLRRNDQIGHAEVSPIQLQSPWRAPCGRLSGIMAGLSLCDMALAIDAEPIGLHQVDAPLVLLGLLARAARTRGGVLQMSCATGCALTDGHGLLIAGDFSPSESLQISLVDAVVPPSQGASRLVINPEVLAGLNAFCARTYAPATAQSRASGAGAGVTDND
ncbi:DUF3726 domain-containing protein [Litorivicinus lipolyticus]|uniref:DUF3726 domain-containing protein n=1 Tax=Litorivicinus lipolyticus TaxID=418701 RepID=A0A5Q2QHD7_9GAMM|nr:DUF3726 domain-containing protein [Litorivicinus lipolyticus]QGG80435.1 DUF3726 domain-containing protein [Litorivicinus lipolyticus]